MMQWKPQYRDAFRNGHYDLKISNEPITSIDWHTKVSPWCTVNFNINSNINQKSDQAKQPETHDGYNGSLRSSSSDQRSTQTVVPSPTNFDDEPATLPEKEPPQLSLSKTDSSVFASHSGAYVGSSSQRDDVNNAPTNSHHATTALQTYVEDADDDDDDSSNNQPSLVVSPMQHQFSAEEPNSNVYINEGKADSVTGIGNDNTRPMKESSIEFSLSPTSNSSSEVKMGETTSEEISSNSLISSFNSSIQNETAPGNQKLVVPAATTVFDYLVPRFDDEPMVTPNDTSSKMNPFAYQDLNNAWESRVSMQSFFD